MTPDELDAIEATISESTAWDGWGLDRAQVSDLIAALREAWAERDRQRDEAVQYRDRAWKAEAERDRMRDGVWKAEAERDRMRDGGACDNCRERERNAVIRAEKAETGWGEALDALYRVRAVIAPRTAHDCPSCGVLAREVEAAIEGPS